MWVNLEQVLSDPDLTQEKLFSIYEAALRETFPTAEIEAHSPNNFQVKVPGQQTFIVHLNNLWITLKRQPKEDRVKVFEKHLRAVRTSFVGETELERRRENIVPMIKDVEYLKTSGEKPQLVSEHLAGDIWIIYGVDLPDAIKTLKPDTLRALGLTSAELRTVACDNLRRILPEIERHGSGPWYFLKAGGDYVASILLLDEVWSQLEEIAEGDVVAAVPARDVLLFTGSQSREGIEAIKQRAREVEQHGDHVISQTLLRRVSGSWKVFE